MELRVELRIKLWWGGAEMRNGDRWSGRVGGSCEREGLLLVQLLENKFHIL